MSHIILTSVYGGVALLFLILGFVSRAKRVLLFTAALMAAGGAGAAWVGSFWQMVC